MDIQQAINLTLFRRFAEVGAAFAYPTQTLRVAELPEPRDQKVRSSAS